VAEIPVAEVPRKRSTVREAVIFPSETAVPPAVSSPAPVSQESSPEPEPAGSDAADKPRRTGWWAKRLLGGKG